MIPVRPHITSTAGAGLLFVFLGLMIMSCQSDRPMDPTKALIMKKTEDLFTRIKVLDYSVIYEDEFPYFREETSLEDYLRNRYLQWYKADTMRAIQIDSVSLWDDTAYVHMMMEWVLADSSLKVDTIRLKWYKIGGQWYKPSLSYYERQKEFEEELRVYWEAVGEIEKRQKQSSDTSDTIGQ